MRQILIGALALGSICSFGQSNESGNNPLNHQLGKTCLLMDAVKAEIRTGYGTVKFNSKQKRAILDKGYSLIEIKGRQGTSRYLRNVDRKFRKYDGKLFLTLERFSSDNSYLDNSCSFPESCTNHSNSLVLHGTARGKTIVKEFGAVYSQNKVAEVNEANQRVLDKIQELQKEASDQATVISRHKAISREIKSLRNSYDSSLDDVSQVKASWLDKLVTDLPSCEEIY
ncbi:MAG: hypothetical protein N4A33_05850 [Bacteriovoracaceae bacterium]|nr:hypothetical protein [Bacteriovoracaceae bacterium]